MLESIQKAQSPLALAPPLAAAIKRGEEAVPIQARRNLNQR